VSTVSIVCLCVYRSLQTELVSSVLLQILSVYKSNLQDTSGHVTQAVALQYLFDVWYLSSTLLWRESDKVFYPLLFLLSTLSLSLLCLYSVSPLSVWVSTLSLLSSVCVGLCPLLSSACVGLYPPLPSLLCLCGSLPSPALSPLSISLVDYKSGYLSVAMEIVMFKVSSCVGFPLLEYKVC